LLIAKTEIFPEPEFVTKAKLEGAVGGCVTFLLMPQPFSRKIVTMLKKDRTSKRGARRIRRINREESIAIISQIFKDKINDTRE
jgi:hypothetical protein